MSKILKPGTIVKRLPQSYFVSMDPDEYAMIVRFQQICTDSDGRESIEYNILKLSNLELKVWNNKFFKIIC